MVTSTRTASDFDDALTRAVARRPFTGGDGGAGDLAPTGLEIVLEDDMTIRVDSAPPAPRGARALAARLPIDEPTLPAIRAAVRRLGQLLGRDAHGATVTVDGFGRRIVVGFAGSATRRSTAPDRSTLDGELPDALSPSSSTLEDGTVASIAVTSFEATFPDGVVRVHDLPSAFAVRADERAAVSRIPWGQIIGLGRDIFCEFFDCGGSDGDTGGGGGGDTGGGGGGGGGTGGGGGGGGGQCVDIDVEGDVNGPIIITGC